MQLLRKGSSSMIEPFPLYCNELCLILQQARSYDHRMIIAQQFSTNLIDERYDQAVAFIKFATERDQLLQTLRTANVFKK